MDKNTYRKMKPNWKLLNDVMKNPWLRELMKTMSSLEIMKKHKPCLLVECYLNKI